MSILCQDYFYSKAYHEKQFSLPETIALYRCFIILVTMNRYYGTKVDETLHLKYQYFNKQFELLFPDKSLQPVFPDQSFEDLIIQSKLKRSLDQYFQFYEFLDFLLNVVYLQILSLPRDKDESEYRQRLLNHLAEFLSLPQDVEVDLSDVINMENKVRDGVSQSFVRSVNFPKLLDIITFSLDHTSKFEHNLLTRHLPKHPQADYTSALGKYFMTQGQTEFSACERLDFESKMHLHPMCASQPPVAPNTALVGIIKLRKT